MNQNPTTVSLRFAGAALGAALAGVTAFAQTPAPAPTRDKAEKESRVDVTVSASAPASLDTIGNTTLSREEIGRQVTGRGDVNLLARTMNNVQFDSARGSITEDTILNIRPALLSISGGRTYENNFVVEGLSTTSVTDTTNTNIHAFDRVMGHPQTTFVNPDLVDKITVYTNDVPAQYGGFTGGLVELELRDPSGRWGAGGGFGYTSSDLTHYKTAPEHRSDAMPEKPTFHKESYDFYSDIPLSTKAALLVAWSRETSTLDNTQRMASYGLGVRSATSVKDNYLAKLLYRLSPETKLRFTTVYTPYEQENYEQGLKRQDNNGWLNKAELSRTTERGELTAYAGYQWGDDSRKQDPDLYTYKNFGAGDQVDWVADSSATGARGGNGDMDSTQRDIPVGFKYVYALTRSGKLAFGADYSYTQARKQRPITNNAYRHQSIASAVLDPSIVSAFGRDDWTVLEGEQALNYRLEYRAFDAVVELQSADAWAQWYDEGRLFGLPWSYRAGLRYDTNDFLENHDFAPRLTAQLEPLSWLRVNAGFNRYYTHSMLAYKLQEKYPGTYAYTRTYALVDGRKVYSDDWTLYLHSESLHYGQTDVKTPYTDEYTLGFSADFKKLGSATVTLLKRQYRDEFSSNSDTKIPYVNEKTGAVSSYTLRTVTNGGRSDYESAAVEWTKRWRNNAFRVGATFSKTRTTTEDYFSEAEDEEKRDELVYRDGELVTRRSLELERKNYADPQYVNFAWSSDWLSSRLKVDLLGRWNTAYDRLEDNDSTIKIDGSSYPLIEKVHVPSMLINDLNVEWLAWETRRGSVSLQVKIANLFDCLPHSSGATSSAPYQEGRAVWSRVSYRF